MLARLNVLLMFLTFIVSSQVLADEKLVFELDGRTWKIGFENASEQGFIVEMVADNEEIMNWSELFTIQTFSGFKDKSAKEFEEALEKAFKQDILEKINKKIRFNFIDKDVSNILESSFVEKDPQPKPEDINNDEYNIGRIIKFQDHIYYLRYSARDKKTFDQSKDKWVQRLKVAFVTDTTPPEHSSGHWFSLVGDQVYEGHTKLTYKAEAMTVSDPDAQFTLSLPSNWLVNEEWVKEEKADNKGGDTVALLFMKPDKQIYGGVAFQDISKTEAEDLDYNPRKNFLQTYAEQNKGMKLIKKGNVDTRLGNSGQYVIIEDDNEIAWISLFLKGTRLYRLEIWSPKPQFEEQKAQMEEILSNFHIE